MSRGGITPSGIVSALLLGVVFLVPAILWTSGGSLPAFLRPARAPGPPPPSISTIQNMSELVPARVHISDFLEGANDHYRVTYALHGEVMIGVDLGRIAYAKVLPEAREAVLLLPSPHVLSAKVDHERSYEIRLEWLVWVPTSDPKRLRDEVWKQADLKLARLGEEPGYRERARVQTERVLTKLFEGVGWKVTFEWQDGGTAGE